VASEERDPAEIVGKALSDRADGGAGKEEYSDIQAA
jgi:hypothetical protein